MSRPNSPVRRRWYTRVAPPPEPPPRRPGRTSTGRSGAGPDLLRPPPGQPQHIRHVEVRRHLRLHAADQQLDAHRPLVLIDDRASGPYCHASGSVHPESARPRTGRRRRWRGRRHNQIARGEHRHKAGGDRVQSLVPRHACLPFNTRQGRRPRRHAAAPAPNAQHRARCSNRRGPPLSRRETSAATAIRRPDHDSTNFLPQGCGKHATDSRGQPRTTRLLGHVPRATASDSCAKPAVDSGTRA